MRTNSFSVCVSLACHCLIAYGQPSSVLKGAGLEIRIAGDLKLRKNQKQHGEVFLFEVLLPKGTRIGQGCIANHIDDPANEDRQLPGYKRNGIHWVYAVRGQKVSFVGRFEGVPNAPAISLGIVASEYAKNPKAFLNLLDIKETD